MGRGRGVNAATAVTGFDAIVGSRRGGGRAAEEPELSPSSPDVPAPQPIDVRAVVNRLRGADDSAVLVALQGLKDWTLPPTDCEALRESVAAHVWLRVVRSGMYRHTASLVGVTPRALEKEAAPGFNWHELKNRVPTRIDGDIADVRDDLYDRAHRRAKDMIARLAADELSFSETAWKTVPDYPKLRKEFGQRRLLPDRDLHEVADRDELVAALDGWLANGAAPTALHKTLADALAASRYEA